MSEAHKGIKRSQEICEKISKGHKGKHHTEETKRKISEGGKGKHSSKKHTEQSRKKLSEINKGKKFSKETRRKLSESLRGEKNRNWKGGISLLTTRIRDNFKYRQWRSDIFTRDNFTCVLCGVRNGSGETIYLEADHYPIKFSEIFHKNKIKTLEEALNCEEFWNINNGRTLCSFCHNLITWEKNHVEEMTK